MNETALAKRLLEGNCCQTCSQYNKDSVGKEACLYWWGEAIGWQHRELPEEEVCEHWANSEDEHARA